MKRKAMTAGIAVLALGVGGAGVATALGSGGATPTGSGASQAKEAALAITGGGKANQVERDNENGAKWEVEVTKPDGNTVDVRLDGAFKKVAVESDSGDAGENEANDAGPADDHGANEKAEHGAETNDDGQSQAQR